MKDFVGIGIIGCGSVGRIHANCISQISSAKLISVYDIKREYARKMASIFGCEAADSTERLFNNPNIDAVYICTPHNTHADLVMAALRHEKHVFCEKPLALRPEKATMLAEEAASRGLMLTVGFNHRFTKAVAYVRDFVKGQDTNVILAQLQFSCAPFMEGWPSDPNIGGGVLHCLGSHAFDLLWYVIQKPLTWVYCVTTRRRLPAGSAPDTAIVTLGFEGGEIAVCVLHDHAPYTFSVENMVRLELVLKEGVVLAWGIKGVVEWFSAKDDTLTYKAFYKKGTVEERWGYLEENQRFITRLQGGNVELPAAWDGVRACRVVKAAELSAQCSRPIKINDVQNS